MTSTPEESASDVAWPALAPTGGTADVELVSGDRPVTVTSEHDADDVPTERRLLVRLLGEATLDLDVRRHARLWGWIGPLLVTALAAVLRFVDLGRPHALVFDETYYVKQAYTLLKVGYEARWPTDPNPAFEAGRLDTFLLQPDYAVHPPVGKWLIALGMQAAGPASSTGWRLSAAVAGTLAVLMIARIARRLFASTTLGVVAGLLFAVDGEAIVHSRTGLLDQYVMFFALAAFGALLLDRDRSRRRLARRAAEVLDSGGSLGRRSLRGHPAREDRRGRSAPGAEAESAHDAGTPHGAHTSQPAGGWRSGLALHWADIRWWRLAAGVLLGLCIGTKWSGVYFLAVLGLLSVAWDAGARRAVGQRRWVLPTLRTDAVPAGLAMVTLAAATYLGSWFSWFRSPGAYLRQWAVEHPGEGVQWLPASLRSLWKYHQDMWQFHNHLESPHAYAASPLGWLVQWRPTSLYYPDEVSGLDAQASRALCGADRCSQAITSLGNPVIWWAATLSIVVAAVWLSRRRDWRAAAVLSGIVAGWVPWLGYAHRTIFTFYSIAFAPWMVLTLTYVIGLLVASSRGEPLRRRAGVWWVGVFLALVLVVSAFYYPIWTARVVPYDFWHLHMWLPSWI